MEYASYIRSLQSQYGKSLSRKDWIKSTFQTLREENPHVTARNCLSWAKGKWERHFLDVICEQKETRNGTRWTARILGFDVTLEARYDQYTDTSWLGSFTDSPEMSYSQEYIRFDSNFTSLPGILSGRDFSRRGCILPIPVQSRACGIWKEQGRNFVEKYRKALHSNMETLLKYYNGDINEYACTLEISRYGEVLYEDSLCGVTDPLDYLTESLFHALCAADEKENLRAA